MIGRVEEIAVLKARVQELESSLQDAKMFVEWVECLVRTEAEIYRGKLRARAALALERIEKVLG